LGFWTVTGDNNVTPGNFGAVVLNGKIINSERYSFPVLALSTGSGAPGSSSFLNPDDSRLQIQLHKGQRIEGLNGFG
jgi:hypothetical protein